VKALLLLVLAADALVNTTWWRSLAVDGHDVVALHAGKIVKGEPRFESRVGEAVYRFATAEAKATFDAAPARWAPAFGGYCAYAASRGYVAGIDVDTAQVVGGRLILQYAKTVPADFNKDLEKNLKLADENWPGIVAKETK